MTQTLHATLRKLAISHPARLAKSISGLQLLNEHLNDANHWLATRWDGVLKAASSGMPSLAADRRHYSLAAHLDSGEMLEGTADQMALWTATIDGIHARAIHLGPPVQVAFTVPHGDQGLLKSAIALHPDVWDNPASGGCSFLAMVDDRAAFRLTIDPIQNPLDRTWLPFELPIPATDTGSHRVVLATVGVDGNAHRWALWRDPYFVWNSDGESAGGEGRDVVCTDPPHATHSEIGRAE